jgi:myo-inositol-1(or 4)-monophosphatase
MPSYLETSMEIAREAGAVLSGYFKKHVAYQLKGEFDLVTEADRASEALVVERLRSHFPNHSIVAEEGGGQEGDSEYRWYVDPLDGTTNFFHGFPMFNVTLALERAGESIAGCIYDPVRRWTNTPPAAWAIRPASSWRPWRPPPAWWCP